jgi:predicted permease
VEAAELTTVLPMTWNDQRATFYPATERPERPEDAPIAGFRRASSGYLKGLEVPLVSGRFLAATDRPDGPAVAVLSESAARRFFPGGDAVGHRLARGDRLMEVVGIVGDVRGNPLTADAPRDVVYVPLAQWTARTAYLVVPTRGNPSSLVPALQTVIGQLDPRLAAGEVAPMEQVVTTVTAPQSATMQMLAVSAVIALVMAAVGTYGVMSYAVARQTRELGIRVALGATHTGVVRLVVGGAARMALTGVGIGLVGALALGRGMQGILVDTSPSDPRVLGAAATLLGVVALVAGYLPARRAASVDPIVALRNE